MYSVDGPSGPEFTYTGVGGLSCALPDVIFVWGQNDTGDTSFANGTSARDNYLATAGCGPDTTSSPIVPCLAYTSSCTHQVAWCPIPGMGHAKINAAFNAGPQRVIETIESNFDVPISHYLQVDFAGFREMVNKLGSIPIKRTRFCVIDVLLF